MLKIEKDSNAAGTILRLSGRIQEDGIACIRNSMNGVPAPKVLDLTDVTLVDIAGVRFLIGCEDHGIELSRCPPWVSEWMIRERAEEP